MRTRGLWSLAAAVALMVGLAWLARQAVAETAFEWSLRHRVPRLEERVDLLEERQAGLDAVPPPWAKRLIELLEAEKAAREGAR